MIYKNARITTAEEQFYGWLEVDAAGVLLSLNRGATRRAGHDCQGQIIMPAFIDSHLHGGYGFSFNDLGDQQHYQKLLEQLKTEGIGAFVGTTVTAPLPQLSAALDTMAALLAQPAAALPQLVGWYFEGPFIAAAKRGAHEAQLIQPLDAAFLAQVRTKLAPWPIICTVAAETAHNRQLVAQYQDDFIFALGHSNASYDAAVAMLQQGTKRITHLYNAMSGFHHSSQTGIVNALVNKEFAPGLCIELIADGVHVAPEVIRFTYNHFGAAQLCLVSDALPAKGLPDGQYRLGNLAIDKRQQWFYLAQSQTLAGSALKYNMLLQLFKTTTGCSWSELVKVSSYNAARNLNLPAHYGALVCGQVAKFVIVDEELNVLQTIL